MLLSCCVIVIVVLCYCYCRVVLLLLSCCVIVIVVLCYCYCHVVLFSKLLHPVCHNTAPVIVNLLIPISSQWLSLTIPMRRSED